MGFRRLRITGSLITVVGTISGAAAAFAAAIVAARALEIDEFALFGVGLAINSLAVQLADLGFGVVTVAETAGSWRAGRTADTVAKLALLTRRRVLSSLGLVAVVALAALTPVLGEYRDVALIAVGGAVFGSLQLFSVSALQAAERYRQAGVLQIVTGTLRLVLVVGCAVAGLGAEAMLAGYAVIAPALGAVAGGAAIVLANGHATAWRNGGRGGAGVDPGLARAMAVAFVSAALLFNLDLLILVLFADRDDVATYAAAWRVAAGVLLAANAFAAGLLPSSLLGTDAGAELRRLVRLGVGVALLLLVLAPVITVAGVALLGKAGDDAATALALLLVAFAIQSYTLVVVQLYLRCGRPWIPAGSAVAQLAVLVGVTLAALPLGAEAPAVGMLAACVTGAVVVSLPLRDLRRRLRAAAAPVPAAAMPTASR